MHNISSNFVIIHFWFPDNATEVISCVFMKFFLLLSISICLQVFNVYFFMISILENWILRIVLKINWSIESYIYFVILIFTWKCSFTINCVLSSNLMLLFLHYIINLKETSHLFIIFLNKYSRYSRIFGCLKLHLVSDVNNETYIYNVIVKNLNFLVHHASYILLCNSG